MFYYFIPRCEVTGTVKLNGETQTITKGQGWYDHEFGGKMPEEGADRMNYAWNWAAVQLDNKYEITAAILVNKVRCRVKQVSRHQPSTLIISILASLIIFLI